MARRKCVVFMGGASESEPDIEARVVTIEGTPNGRKVTQLLWATKGARTSLLVLGACPGSL